jgi:hypothetical protein
MRAKSTVPLEGGLIARPRAGGCAGNYFAHQRKWKIENEKLKIESHERRRSIFHLKFFIFHFASGQ